MRLADPVVATLKSASDRRPSYMGLAWYQPSWEPGGWDQEAAAAGEEAGLPDQGAAEPAGCLGNWTHTEFKAFTAKC